MQIVQIDPIRLGAQVAMDIIIANHIPSCRPVPPTVYCAAIAAAMANFIKVIVFHGNVIGIIVYDSPDRHVMNLIVAYSDAHAVVDVNAILVCNLLAGQLNQVVIDKAASGCQGFPVAA